MAGQIGLLLEICGRLATVYIVKAASSRRSPENSACKKKPGYCGRNDKMNKSGPLQKAGPTKA